MKKRRRKDCYLNGEHYCDPTAGEAIANVCGDNPGPRLVEGDDFPEDCLEKYKLEKQLAEDWEDSIETATLNGAPTPDLISRCMSGAWGQCVGNGRKLDQVTFEDFANGIIVQAATDYRKARRIPRDSPDASEARQTIRDIEAFFLSRWYSQLTTLKGEKLLKMLEEEKIE